MSSSPKEVSGIFYRRLYCFIVISASNQLLSIALVSAVSVYSAAVCGLTCGQRVLLDQVQQNCSCMVRRALYHVQVWGIVPPQSLRGKSFYIRHIKFYYAIDKE